jgi:hypothetical protein
MDFTLISGDVHGLAEQFIERYFDGKLLAPGFAGASGDIDPWYRVLPGFETKNGWIPEPVLLGTLLGEEVVHVFRNTECAICNGSAGYIAPRRLFLEGGYEVQTSPFASAASDQLIRRTVAMLHRLQTPGENP